MAAGHDVALELEEGARLLEDAGGEPARRRPAAPARRGRRRSAARAARSTSGSAPAFDDEVVALVAGMPDARLSSTPPHRAVGRPSPAPPTPPGTSCSRGRSAGCGEPPSTCPTWPTSASTSSTCRRSTRSAPPTARAGTTASPRRRTTRAARGPSARPTAATTPCTPSSARSTTSTPSSPPPRELGLEIALDYALQCSPDHPWVRDHPEWFTQRPDGSIRYAENPPKKYQDIHPIEFWPAAEADRRRPLERVPRRARALDRPRRAHVPGRQPPHQAARVLGVGDRRRPRTGTPTSCSSPRRSPTPP